MTFNPACSALLSIAALLTLSACSSSGTPTDTTAVADTPGAAATSAEQRSPEEDLATYVERRLSQGFVANCEDAERPDDVAKQCARRLGERNGLLAYALGPTFAEYTRILILAPQDNGWTIRYQENHDPEDPDVPGIPWPLEVGAEVVVAGTAPDCLKIREEPRISGLELNCINDGTQTTIVGGPTTSDEIEWWQLEGLGWAAGSYLRYEDDTTIVATPTPKD